MEFLPLVLGVYGLLLLVLRVFVRESINPRTANSLLAGVLFLGATGWMLSLLLQHGIVGK